MSSSKGKNHKWISIQKTGSILIRFTYQTKTYRFAPVKQGRYDNPQDMAIANKVASEIELSIKLGTFTSIVPWLNIQLTEYADKEVTLDDVWSAYKIAKADKVSKASQVSQWLQVDRCLDFLKLYSAIDNHKLEITKISQATIIKLLLAKYTSQVIARVCNDLHAACNLAVKRKLIAVNPLLGYKDYLPDKPKSDRSKECYSHDEVKLIIQSFRYPYTTLDLNPDKPYPSRHYANFVEFLFLTGVRPQLAIALTWGDVKSDKIIFNKGFTHGQLTTGKTGRITHYPLYPQLSKLMAKHSFDISMCLNDCLVFPSPTGKYIDLRNFTKRIWTPVINRLVELGKVSKYLPTYHCRHSTATFLAKAGLPTSTIAALLDTSEAMLNRHYLDNQELTNVAIPDLLAR